MNLRQVWLGNVDMLAKDRTITLTKHVRSHYDRAIVSRMLLLNTYSNFHGACDMAKRTKDSKTSSWGVTFVSWRPTDEDKLIIRDYVNNLKSISEPLEDIIANGYKISVSYDGEADTFITSLTNREAAPEFKNHCITFRHRDMYTAFGLLIWFELEYTSGDWSIVEQSSNFDW